MLGKDGYVRIHGRCFELSEAGMGAITSSEIAVGEMASAELSIMDSPEPIAVSVVVRHRLGYRLGCEFVGLHPEQAERIGEHGGNQAHADDSPAVEEPGHAPC